MAMLEACLIYERKHQVVAFLGLLLSDLTQRQLGHDFSKQVSS